MAIHEKDIGLGPVAAHDIPLGALSLCGLRGGVSVGEAGVLCLSIEKEYRHRGVGKLIGTPEDVSHRRAVLRVGEILVHLQRLRVGEPDAPARGQLGDDRVLLDEVDALARLVGGGAHAEEVRIERVVPAVLRLAGPVARVGVGELVFVCRRIHLEGEPELAEVV